MDKPTKTAQPFGTKKAVVERCLAGELAIDLAKEQRLSPRRLIEKWATQWRGDDALWPKPTGRPKGTREAAPLTETEQLCRELNQLQAENAYLKTLRDLRDQGRASR